MPLILNENELIRFGSALAQVLQPDDCVLLFGDLGAGKTTLARAIIQCMLGNDDDVPSPTFTLVQSYRTPRFELWHYDLYRLEDAGELVELALDEALNGGVCLIEWPERALSLLPEERLEIRLETTDDPMRRHMSLKGSTEWQARLASWR